MISLAIFSVKKPSSEMKKTVKGRYFRFMQNSKIVRLSEIINQMKELVKFKVRSKGQALIEYVLIMLLVVSFSVAATSLVNGKIKVLWSKMMSTISDSPSTMEIP
jgi:Flp pilus assembly pilin Flp